MAGDTPYEAVRAFVAPIQEAISCFVSGKIEADRFDDLGEGRLTLNRGGVVRLPGQAKVAVELMMRYAIVEHPEPAKGPFKISTRGWIYHITDQHGSAVLQYHWHPQQNVEFPHLHHGNSGPHYPTGRVLIEDVLQAAVEVGAEPLDRDRWQAVRTTNRAMFERGATWGSGPGHALDDS